MPVDPFATVLNNKYTAAGMLIFFRVTTIYYNRYYIMFYVRLSQILND